MSRIAIVAALEREVGPLIRKWRVNEKEYGGRRFRFFENGDVVLVCGGIGAEPARRAAEAVIVLYGPGLVYSAGYAGALDPALRIGDVLKPERVIHAGDGSRVTIADGKGVLVSYEQVATREQKGKLREAFGAQAVDMESSAVARAAEARGIGFAAIKAISDDVDFEIPATEQFVDQQGRFREMRFAFFVTIRPWLWPRVMRLMNNSRRATEALCQELERLGKPDISTTEMKVR
jgi:adenosylhomocysteine nucleosidase